MGCGRLYLVIHVLFSLQCSGNQGFKERGVGLTVVLIVILRHTVGMGGWGS